MEFKYSENEDGTRTVYAFASHAPAGTELKSFELDTSKEGLTKALQELFNMIDWDSKAKDEEPKAPESEAMDTLLDYADMPAQQRVRFRTLLEHAWPILPVAFRSDLIMNFMEEVVRPLKVNYETTID
tara:strand:+ start:199 stop:582 length:384 start_codon:yes stop_codon:yes gene_type:complete